MQSKSEKLHSLGEISADEAIHDHSASATKTFHAVFGYERVRCAVRQISKSVVRDIRTLRSEGVGTANWAVPSTRRSGGQPPGSTWQNNKTYSTAFRSALTLVFLHSRCDQHVLQLYLIEYFVVFIGG